MQVRYALPAVRADVGDNAKTIGATFASQTRRDLHQMPQSLRIASCGIQSRGFGNDEKMRWRLRRDVEKSETKLVFVNDVGGNFAADDFVEDGFVHGVQLLQYVK